MAKQIGRYLIDGPPKTGGMGKVYPAVDPEIGRRVAIKVIKLGEFGDVYQRDTLTKQLRREAQAAGQLSHPNIVTIHDVVVEGDSVSLVMEFIEGAALNEWLKGEPVDRQVMISIVRQAASALDYAHSRGIVHRDIKPPNIMIQKNGLAKILDFGIAKLATSHSMAQTGLLFGTPGYSSPEQYRSDTVDGRSDQFSLAVVCYEMLTGVRPFAGDTPLRVMHKVLFEEPPLVEELNPRLGPGVSQVLRRALAKDPPARFRTCTDLAKELEKSLGVGAVSEPDSHASLAGAALAPQIIKERPAQSAAVRPSPAQPMRGPVWPHAPPRKRSRPAIWLASLAAVVLVGLFGLWVHQQSSTGRPPPPPPRTRLKITTPSALPNGTTGLAYSASLAVSGDSTPLRWSVENGSLPPGLSVDLDTGTISGVPSRAGAYQFILRATDRSGAVAAQDFRLTIHPAKHPLALANTPSLPGAVVGKPYSQMLAGSGGTPPYRWQVSAGSLPPRLVLDSFSGAIRGTATDAGTFRFTVRATDDEGATASQALSLTVNRGTPPLAVVTASVLLAGTVGKSYAASVTGSGGNPPYNWAVDAGKLPDGLSLDSAKGLILGSPTASGTFQFTLRVTDASQATASQAFTLTVGRSVPPFEIASPPALPGGTTGAAYSHALNVKGGEPPYSWYVAAGGLPPGVSLDSVQGVLSGVPASAGSFRFTLRATDRARSEAQQDFTLRIALPLVITTVSPFENAVAGKTFNQLLAASGGSGTYQWSVAAGSLPPGLSLEPTRGILSGIATGSGEFRFTLRVTDSTQATATKQFTLLVAPQPPRSGQVVWQGVLESGQAIIIDGSHASAGSISSAALPGVPVEVQIREPSGVEIQTRPGEKGLRWTQMVILNNSLQRRTRVVIQWTEKRQ